MRTIVVVTAIAAFGLSVIIAPKAVAQEPATPTPATRGEIPSASTPEPTPSPTERPPATLGPATPTPELPEEGGPAGGVISGTLYADLDGDRSRSEGDGAIPGSVVGIERIDDQGVAVEGDGVTSDGNGHWERRSLPDGRYRVTWEPPIDPKLYSQTIPPAETIVVNPRLTIQRVTQIVEIRGANHVAGVDFGIPRPIPVAGVSLPSSGTGTNAGEIARAWLLAGAMALALATGHQASAP